MQAVSQPAADGAFDADAAVELAEVRLEQGADGQVAFKLTLSPSKVAPAAAAQAVADAQAGEEAARQDVQQESADPGHMPASPDAVSSVGRPPLLRRRVEPPPTRPGALYDGAARGACWERGRLGHGAQCLRSDSACPSVLHQMLPRVVCDNNAASPGVLPFALAAAQNRHCAATCLLLQSCCASCATRWTRASPR